MKDISVIIPVYNVEKYIAKCINSIVNQTFENYEVILVDDGSTDNSGIICDKLASKNEKIKVYHKSNGGLSDARNYGVKMATSKYITFIDSDDYVRCDYLELMFNSIEKYDSDISVVLQKIVYEDTDYSITYNKGIENSVEVMKGVDLLKYALLGKKGTLSSCGKLYKKECILAQPFPIGKLYEDMEVMFNIYLKTLKVAIVNENAYFYLRRKNSIVNSRVTENHLYGIKSCIKMLDFNTEKNKNLDKYIKSRIVMQACGHLPNLVEYKDREMFDKIAFMVKKYIKQVAFKRDVPIKLSVRAVAYLLGNKLGLLYAKSFISAKKAFKNLKNNKVVRN